MSESTLARDIADARLAAHAKHGGLSIEGLHAMDPLRVPILTEEVGEVARAWLGRDRAQMRAELVQVAAVASAWIDALDREEG